MFLDLDHVASLNPYVCHTCYEFFQPFTYLGHTLWHS